MGQRYYVLQSGFVTSEATQLVRSEEANLSLKDRLYAGDRQLSDTENYYDEEIEKLFNIWQKDDALIRHFEFREQILKAAVRLFGSDARNMGRWINLQLDKRTVAYLHRKFLKEMLASALNSTPKTMDNVTYYRLLGAATGSTNLKTGVDRANDELIDYVRNARSVDLSEILFNWTKDTRGISDLLHSMHVIFGKRSGAGALASNTGVSS